jgi:Fe2+ or Zn2+ uptake regulation protein
MRDAHRQLAIMSVLHEHPTGIAAENLVRAVCPPDSRVERQRTLRSLNALADSGRIRVTGKPHPRSIASALVTLAGR